jgi:hypothetical protein
MFFRRKSQWNVLPQQGRIWKYLRTTVKFPEKTAANFHIESSVGLCTATGPPQQENQGVLSPAAH